MRKRLTNQLVVRIVLLSTLLATIATAIQLYFDYRIDAGVIQKNVDQITTIHQKPLIEALWSFNAELVSAELQALSSLQGINYIEVVESGIPDLKVGTERDGDLLTELPLTYEVDGIFHFLGTLRVGATLDGVYDRLFDRFVVVLATNALKLLVVSLFMLLLLRSLVTKPIKQLTSYVRQMDFDGARLKDIEAEQASGRPSGNEINEIEQAILALERDLQKTQDLLKQERDDLERQVVARTRELNEAKVLAEQGEKKFHTLADFAYDWEMWISESGQILYVSPSCYRISGYTDEELKNNPELLSDMVHPEDREVYASFEREYQADSNLDGIEYRVVSRSGDEIWIEHRRQKVIGDSGESLGYRVSNREATERKEQQQRTEFFASHDSLTGLPNRYLLKDRLDQAISLAERHGSLLAVLFMDLDGFKPVNDSLGHAAGDLVLKELAARLTANIRGADTAARLGGDEFVVLLTDAGSSEDVESTVQKLQRKLTVPYRTGEVESVVGVSIGVAVFPTDGVSPEALIAAADSALYEVKNSRKGTYRFANLCSGRFSN